MTTAWPHLKRLVQKLGFQIAFLLAVALLPLSIISMLTATNAERDARARSEQALIGLTMIAVSGEVALIQQTRGTAGALALTVDAGDCNDLMHRVALDHPAVALAAFIGTAGDLRCSSVPLNYDFAADKVFAAALAANGPTVAVGRSGPVSMNSILLVSHPVRDSSGQKIGMIAITLPYGVLKSSQDQSPLEILTFDIRGEVLTASSGMDTATLQLPQDETLANLSHDQPVAFFGRNKAGDGRVFAAVPIVGGSLFALGTWPEAPKSDLKSTLLSAPLLAPLLMWFASLIVAWLGVERLVIRNIHKLRQSMRSFASGSRSVGDIDMRGAPSEIREMSCAYRQMTDSIIRDEAALEDIVHQKEVLLREVHHRVKNNLQLIASIMSMHIRKAQNTETREVIRKLQDRVMSLATIHRELYQTVGLTDVHAAELLSSITMQVIKLSALPDRSVAVSKSFDDVVLTPDQAVPLALLLAEALGNALKYDANPTQPTVAIEVSLRAVPDGRAVLQVSHSTTAQSGPVVRPVLDNDALSIQLLAAFAAQLGGDIQRTADQHTSRLVIEFALRPLTDAEARNAG